MLRFWLKKPRNMLLESLQIPPNEDFAGFLRIVPSILTLIQLWGGGCHINSFIRRALRGWMLVFRAFSIRNFVILDEAGWVVLLPDRDTYWDHQVYCKLRIDKIVMEPMLISSKSTDVKYIDDASLNCYLTQWGSTAYHMITKYNLWCLTFFFLNKENLQRSKPQKIYIKKRKTRYKKEGGHAT